MNRLFRDPNPGDGGGGGLTPEQQQAAEQEALKLEAFEGDQLKPGYIQDAEGNISKLPEGSDAEGNPLEGYTKDEEGNFVKIDETTEEGTIYEALEKFTGENYLEEVDFAGADPDTPEGLAAYLNVVKTKTRDDFEKLLEQTLPDAYAYMLHLQAGGTKEEFFQQGTLALPNRKEFEANSDLQAQLIRNSLQGTIPDDIIQLTIDKYIKDNRLGEEALKLYDKQEQSRADQLAHMQRLEKEQTDRFNAQVSNLVASIDSTIDSNALRFVVPEAKRTEFANYAKSMLQYSNEQFYITQPISKDNVKQVLEGLFFQYSGNDLKKVIEKQAGTLASNKFKWRVQKDAAREKGGDPTPPASKGFIPLDQFIPNQKKN